METVTLPALTVQEFQLFKFSIENAQLNYAESLIRNELFVKINNHLNAQKGNSDEDQKPENH